MFVRIDFVCERNMPTAKQVRGTYSVGIEKGSEWQNKLAMRKGRQNKLKAMREGKLRKPTKEIGLPHFGSEKQKLEQRVESNMLVIIGRVS